MARECRNCIYFDCRGEDKRGMRYGMCKTWKFSINENDGRGCKRKVRIEQEDKQDDRSRTTDD